MESRNSPIAAGVGGAALVAMLAAPFTGIHMGGSSGTPAAPGATTVVAANATNTPSFNANGPWYAICREYLLNEPESETKPGSHTPTPVQGFFVHINPVEASKEKETVSELSLKNRANYDEKFQVEKHYSANLSQCTQPQAHHNVAIHDPALKVLIATVADPIASQMRLDTDRSIDAISQAAAAEGFYFTSYWLPWPTGNTAVGTATTTDESARSRLQEPGVLIFRKRENDDTKTLLFVLLVGETPTSGLNRLQMARALRDAYDIASNNLAAKKDPLLISGPEFSGSYDSLAELLKASAWKTKSSAGIEVISPDTSVRGQIQWFGKNFELANLNFNGSQIEHAVGIELTRRLGIGQKQIAWLAENQSAFGQSAFGQIASNSDNSGKKVDDEAIKGALRLQYPRDLSSLRNNSDPGAFMVSPADLAGSGSSHREISLTLKEKSAGNADTPPAYAADQEAIGVEAVLKSMLAQMHERNTQAVVITGSNPLDVLYLLDYFRRNLPNTRLAVMDADEFLTTRPSHVSLAGTLVFTGLPLLPGEEVTSMKDGGNSSKVLSSIPITLPSSRATGVYLTTRLLLRPKEEREKALKKLGWEIDTGSAEGQISHRCGDGRGLPVEDLATFVVGRYGLNALGSNLFTYYPIGESTIYLRASVNPFPFGWRFFLGILAILTLWHLVALRKSDEHLVPKWAYPPTPSGLAGCAREECEQFEAITAYRKYYLYVACNQVALLQFAACAITLVLVCSFWDPPVQIASSVHSTAGSRDWVMVLLIVNLALMLLAIRESCVRAYRFGWGVHHFAGTLGRVTVTATHFFPIASVLVWISILTGSTHPGHWLRFQDASAIAIRCSSLSDGLSPFVPFASVILGYFIWALTNLNRLGIACSQRVWVRPVSLPQSGLFGPSGIVTKFHAQLHQQLQNALPSQGWTETVLMVFWIFALCLTGVWGATRGLDGIFFQLWILGFGMFALLYVCAIEILTAFRRWDALKALLDYFERSPISEEFSADRLRAELASMRIWQVGRKGTSLLLQSHTLETFSQHDRSTGLKLLTAWLKRDSEGLWSPAGSTHKLSEFLNHPLAMHVDILDRPPARISISWQESARYLTLRYVALTRYALHQIRNGLSFVLWGFVAAVVCISSYPFQGEHAIGGFVSFACVALLIAIGYLLVQIERHPLLSRLEGTEAGKASFFQIAAQLLSIGGLPLIAVLASQFPAFGDFLFSWVRPAVEAAH